MQNIPNNAFTVHLFHFSKVPVLRGYFPTINYGSDVFYLEYFLKFFRVTMYYYLQGSEWVLGKKSEKCVMPSSRGMHADCKRIPEGYGFLQGVWGSSPRIFLNSRAASGAFQCFFGSVYPNIHTPTHPPTKILFRFTMISGMVQGVGKMSEIRLKSEDSVPCI